MFFSFLPSFCLFNLITCQPYSFAQEVLPIARKLGEKVLLACSAKVKPYLEQAVKDLGISLDDYSKVVATICQDAEGDAKESEVQALDEITVLFLIILISIDSLFSYILLIVHQYIFSPRQLFRI